jgi:AraC-like DNA-binding protein
MERDEIVNRYFEAWNQKHTSGLLKLMHPQASYYDAFWQESCSGKHLAKYLSTNFEFDRYWYRQSEEIISSPNGFIARYEAFYRDDDLGTAPAFNGVDIFTMAEELIMTVSDYYCDPTLSALIEVSMLAEGQHGRANVIQRGLGANTASHIRRRLADIAADATVILDASLTVTILSEHIGCEVMHLFYVLEELQDTTFLDFVNSCRARHASTMMIEAADGDVRFDVIAEQCGFESIKELNDAFQLTFDLTATEYTKKFANY